MYQKGSKSFIKHFDFLLIDILCLNISYVISYFFTQGKFSGLYDGSHGRFVVVLNVIMLVTALLSKSYKNILKRGLYKEFVSVLKLTVITFFAYSFYYFTLQRVLKDEDNNIIWFVIPAFFVICYVCRVVYKRILRFFISKNPGASILIVTTSTIADKVVSQFHKREYGAYTIAGLVIVDKDLTGKKFKGETVVAGLSDAADYVCRQWVDEVLIDVHRDAEFPKKLVKQFETMGLTIHTRIANAYSASTKNQIVETIGGYTVLTTSISYASGWQMMIKRAVDIIGGILGCIATGLAFLVVAPLIYIKSPGPIFFKQERIGKNGKVFGCFKFRTMYTDAEERKKELMDKNRVKDGMMFKLEFDPRIIGSQKLENGKIKKGLGGWLRTLSIDELPQSINVLRGDMSLVGTRPPTLDEWEKYELHHRARLAIKPGITGMWQVSGRSKITDFEEVVRLDTTYIREWSLKLDVKILLKTVVAVLRRDGSM